jgi:hypothetical protein
MSYYGNVFLDYPQDEPTNRFIWRQVFQHVARDNLVVRSELWRVDFNAKLFVNQTLLDQVTDLDHIITSLIADLPATEHPPLTTTYNTADPTTYETLFPTYGPRNYPAIIATNHGPYPTMGQRYATMNMLQQPDPAQITRQDAEFRLHNHIHPDEYAEAMRYHGSI